MRDRCRRSQISPHLRHSPNYFVIADARSWLRLAPRRAEGLCTPLDGYPTLGFDNRSLGAAPTCSHWTAWPSAHTRALCLLSALGKFLGVTPCQIVDTVVNQQKALIIKNFPYTYPVPNLRGEVANCTATPEKCDIFVAFFFSSNQFRAILHRLLLFFITQGVRKRLY